MYFPTTRLGTLNFFLLQWFGIRLAAVSAINIHIGWRFLFGVVPLTGWWGSYWGPLWQGGTFRSKALHWLELPSTRSTPQDDD